MRAGGWIALGAALLAGSAEAQSVETFVYDSLGRLTGATEIRTGFSSASQYTYDAAGNRVVYRNDDTGGLAQGSELAPGERLVLQQSLVSTDGRFRFSLQADGNLAIWFGPGLLWTPNTFGSQAVQLIMQQDGNLVLYGPNYTVLWATGTQATGSRLVMQNDGNLVIYNGWTPVWASGTGGH